MPEELATRRVDAMFEEQNLALWSAPAIDEADRLLRHALSLGRIGPLQIEAALQSAHISGARRGKLDVDAVLALYEGLVRLAHDRGRRGAPLLARARGLFPLLTATLNRRERHPGSRHLARRFSASFATTSASRASPFRLLSWRMPFSELQRAHAMPRFARSSVPPWFFGRMCSMVARLIGSPSRPINRRALQCKHLPLHTSRAPACARSKAVSVAMIASKVRCFALTRGGKAIARNMAQRLLWCGLS